jgi:hypothetical protein
VTSSTLAQSIHTKQRKIQHAHTNTLLSTMVMMNFQSVCLLLLVLSLGLLQEAFAFTTTAGKLATKRFIGAALLHAVADEDEDDDMFDMAAFAARRDQAAAQEPVVVEQEDDFDGYAFRDLLMTKWGALYDVDFNPVDSFGFREIYLNIYPFKMGGRNKWRHASELDYLCHLQAIVEILQKYEQLDKVIYQIQETTKTPKMGAPIKAVPIRLDLTKDEVTKILGR